MPYHYLEDEYRTPYEEFRRAPTPRRADELIKALKPVIDRGIVAYGGGSGPNNPLTRSRAKQITINAMRTYDPVKGPLARHVYGALQGLRRVAMAQRRLLSVPEGVQLDNKLVNDTQRILADELLREPSDREIADRTGLSLKRIAYVRKYKPGFAASQLGRPISEDDTEVEPAVKKIENIPARISYVLEELDPIDRAIVENHFGLYGRKPITGTRLARKLNLSSGAISQRSKRLQEILDELGIEGFLK